MIVMATAAPEEKRPRLSSWDGSTHPHHSVQLPADPSAPYSHHHHHHHHHHPHHVLPHPGAQPPFSDPEPRELPPSLYPPPPAPPSYIPAANASYPPDASLTRAADPTTLKSVVPSVQPPALPAPPPPLPVPSAAPALVATASLTASLPLPPPSQPPLPPTLPSSASLSLSRSLSVSAAADPIQSLSQPPIDHAVATPYPDQASLPPPHPPPAVESPHAISLAGQDGLTPSQVPSHTPSPAAAGQFGYMNMTTYPPRRKAIRAAQACDACRQRKAKCDEGRPNCGFCKEAGIPCVYREVPPPKQDRTLLQVLQKLQELQETSANAQALREEFVTREKVLNDQITALRGENAALRDENRRLRPPSTGNSGPVALGVAATVDAPWTPVAASADPVVNRPPPPPPSLSIENELSIPLDHTTAAHKLLRWPSIQQLVHAVTKNEHYVMEGEERRGLLRVWGRGEGGDLPDGDPLSLDDPGASLPFTTVPSSPAYARPDNADDSVWGHGLLSLGSMEVARPPIDGVGGLGPDGALKLDTTTLVQLMNSYLQNIHILHPFMDTDRLTHMVCTFGSRYRVPVYGQSRYTSFPTSTVPGELRRGSAPLARDNKRKRSTHSSSTLPARGSAGVQALPPPRSIGSVIILLVAALGKVCEHKDYLPGPVPDGFESDGTGMATDSSPSPEEMSPSISVKQSPTPSHSSYVGSEGTSPCSMRPPYATGAPAVADQAAGVRRPPPLNVDVIPGLAYYAYAVDILGSLHGGTGLPHVQAGLLAGLYAGQLGRVLESWRWIHWACISCQTLIKRTKFIYTDNLASANNPELNPIIVAFWTCLQLESDILAELDLPPSGITRLEDKMQFPLSKPDIIWAYYTSQIGLRKLLNRVHFDDSNNINKLSGVLTELEEQLKKWRIMLPSDLQWHDSEDPPSEINAARLRAKYYGARYIIFRPFLHYALHPSRPEPSVKALADKSAAESEGTIAPAVASSSLPSAFGVFSSRPASEVVASPVQADYSHLNEMLIQACGTCIQAAMRSTAAFHGISHRPIVTNVFGTAHAQFGNLLVLQAAARHPVLGELVPKDQLQHLLQKTIFFLKKLSPISPTLKADAKILEMSMLTPQPPPIGSFSSTDGGI